MQVLPLLTPSSFNNNKRSRSDDDVESNYFKKRLISLSAKSTEDNTSHRKEPKYDIHIDDILQQQNENTFNETIPDLLNKKSSTPTSLEAAQAGRLILYKPNTYLPLSPPLSPRKENLYEPMEID